MALPEESDGTQIAMMHVLYTLWLAKWHISGCDIDVKPIAIPVLELCLAGGIS